VLGGVEAQQAPEMGASERDGVKVAVEVAIDAFPTGTVTEGARLPRRDAVRGARLWKPETIDDEVASELRPQLRELMR
jgi:hypothetical protein